MRFRHIAYGAFAGAAQGAYRAYSDPRRYGDAASIAGDAVANILRSAGVNQSGQGGQVWDAVLQGVTQTFLNQYDTLTIATNATPPVTVNLRDALASGPPNPFAKWLQPTVVLTGPGGRQVVAPYGVSAGSQGGPVFLALALIGVGYVFGRLS